MCSSGYIKTWRFNTPYNIRDISGAWKAVNVCVAASVFLHGVRILTALTNPHFAVSIKWPLIIAWKLIQYLRIATTWQSLKDAIILDRARVHLLEDWAHSGLCPFRYNLRIVDNSLKWDNVYDGQANLTHKCYVCYAYSICALTHETSNRVRAK